MATINNICHAIKIIIRLTETLRTSLLIPYNSIYITDRSATPAGKGELYFILKNSAWASSINFTKEGSNVNTIG